jgi:hypothetical protein
VSPEVQAAVQKLPRLTNDQVLRVAALLSLASTRSKPNGFKVVGDGR